MTWSSIPFAVILISSTVLLAIAGHLVGTAWLVYIFKPLATLLVLGIAFANWLSEKQEYALWISAGLLFSLGGDVLLMWPERYFAAGLAAFLLAHIAYLAAFTRGVKFPASWLAWIVCLAVGAGMFFELKARLPAELKLPVFVYALALTTMAAQAMGRSLLLRTNAPRFAAAGGMFFMLSDGLLAMDRFLKPIPYGAIAVLVPYYLAQVLIALSARPNPRSRPETA